MSMNYYKVFDLVIETPFCLAEIDRYETSGHPDIRITEEAFILPEMMQIKNIFRMNLNPDFGGESHDAFFGWGPYGAFRIREGHTITFDRKASESDLLQHFLLTEPLTYALHQRGYYLLHASAVVLPSGEACIFFGEPGAGKSTTMATFLKQGCEFLSDDLVAITFDQDNRPFVLPSFPNIKLTQGAIEALDFDTTHAKPIFRKASKFAINMDGKFHNHPAPLKYIFSLVNDNEKTFQVNKISGIMSHWQSLRHFPLPMMVLEGDGLKKRFVEGTYIQKASESFEIIRNNNNFSEIKDFVASLVRQHQMPALDAVQV